MAMAKPRASRREILKAKPIVLMALAKGLSVTGACNSANISRRTHQEWIKKDPEYAEAVDAAIEAGTDDLEDIVLARARKSSDVLAIFLLKARRPAKYRENVALTGADGGPLTVVVQQFSPPTIEGQVVPNSAPTRAISGPATTRGAKTGQRR